MSNSQNQIEMGDQVRLMEVFARIVGADCEGENPGDHRDENDVLICGVCGEPKEKFRNIPLIGLRKTPSPCKCQRDRFEREDLEREQRRKWQTQEDKLNHCLKFCQIDERFRSSTFSTFKVRPENKRYYQLAKNFVDRFDEFYAKHKGLLFWGEPSSGKTFLAHCIANALLEKHVPVIATTIAEFAPDASFTSKNGERYQELLASINMPDLMVIDDLGSERESSYKFEQVYNGINKRYESKKPVIITTNLTLSQMQDEKDMQLRRIYERVFAMCHPIEVKGINWRWESAGNDYEEIENMLFGK